MISDNLKLADAPRRRDDQPQDRVLLLVFDHVHPRRLGFLVVELAFRQGLAELGFPYAYSFFIIRKAHCVFVDVQGKTFKSAQDDREI